MLPAEATSEAFNEENPLARPTRAWFGEPRAASSHGGLAGNVCHNAGVRMPDEDAVRPWSSASRAQASGRGVGADERAWGRRSQVMLAPLPRPGWDR
jgi:hypothetical protein